MRAECRLVSAEAVAEDLRTNFQSVRFTNWSVGLYSSTNSSVALFSGVSPLIWISEMTIWSEVAAISLF